MKCVQNSSCVLKIIKLLFDAEIAQIDSWQAIIFSCTGFLISMFLQHVTHFSYSFIVKYKQSAIN